MAKERNYKLNVIMSLFDKNGNYKENEDFVEALNLIVPMKNKNDRPFTISQIKDQPKLKDFKFDGRRDFTYTCKLVAEPIKIDGTVLKNEKYLQENL